jgi:hypothetical protein
MRTFRIPGLAIGGLALLTLPGHAGAQTSSPILHILEVRALVASAEALDNVRLSAHFSALADRHAADARRHDAMAQVLRGNPTRRVTPETPFDHCARLSEVNRKAAATLQHLAAHHARVAAGSRSTAPSDGRRFQAGAGAPEPTRRQLRALAARAKTPADHRVLEEYYLTAAARYRQDADKHAATAMAHRATRIAYAAEHWDRITRLDRAKASDALARAAMHARLAQLAG